MDLSKSLNYSLFHCNSTLTYSQPELDQLQDQAVADYVDAMADLAYEMANALREGYDADYYEDAAI
jgi:hypothetical protein